MPRCWYGSRGSQVRTRPARDLIRRTGGPHVRDSWTEGAFVGHARGVGGWLVVGALAVWAMSASAVPRLATAGEWTEVFVVPELVALSVAAYIGFTLAVALTRSVAAGFVLAVLPLTVGPTVAATLLPPLGALTLTLAWSHARRPRQSSLWTQALCVALAGSVEPVWGGALGAASAIGIVARFGRPDIRPAAEELLRYGGVVAVSVLLMATLAVTNLFAWVGLVNARSAAVSSVESGPPTDAEADPASEERARVLTELMGTTVEAVRGEVAQYALRGALDRPDFSRVGQVHTDLGYAVGVTLPDGSRVGFRYEPSAAFLSDLLGVGVAELPDEPAQYEVLAAREAVDFSLLGEVHTDLGYTVGVTLPIGAQLGFRLAPEAGPGKTGRIVVRWVRGLTADERIRIARDHGLNDPGFVSRSTWSYLPAANAAEKLRLLRVHSTVEEIQRDGQVLGPEDDIDRVRVFVRWAESITDEDRQQGESQYGLPLPVQRVGRTWAYRVDSQFDLGQLSADSRVERADSVAGAVFAAEGLLPRIRNLLLGFSPQPLDASLTGEESAFDAAWLRVTTLVRTMGLALVSVLRSELLRTVVLGLLVVSGLAYLFVDRRRRGWRLQDVLLAAALALCLAAVLEPRAAGAAVPGMTVAGACLVSGYTDPSHHPGSS